VFCYHCGSESPTGTLFCPRCGWTIPPAPVHNLHLVPEWSPGQGGVSEAAPPEWVPPSLAGRAVHCVACNTLISSVAVVCPVCLAAQPPRADGAASAAGPR
jgi:hypothetical protein